MTSSRCARGKRSSSIHLRSPIQAILATAALISTPAWPSGDCVGAPACRTWGAERLIRSNHAVFNQSACGLQLDRPRVLTFARVRTHSKRCRSLPFARPWQHALHARASLLDARPAATTARLDTPSAGICAPIDNPWATETPRRTPMNEPGPAPTTMPSKSCSRTPNYARSNSSIARQNKTRVLARRNDMVLMSLTMWRCQRDRTSICCGFKREQRTICTGLWQYSFAHGFKRSSSLGTFLIGSTRGI